MLIKKISSFILVLVFLSTAFMGFDTTYIEASGDASKTSAVSWDPECIRIIRDNLEENGFGPDIPITDEVLAKIRRLSTRNRYKETQDSTLTGSYKDSRLNIGNYAPNEVAFREMLKKMTSLQSLTITHTKTITDFGSVEYIPASLMSLDASNSGLKTLDPLEYMAFDFKISGSKDFDMSISDFDLWCRESIRQTKHKAFENTRFEGTKFYERLENEIIQFDNPIDEKIVRECLFVYTPFSEPQHTTVTGALRRTDMLFNQEIVLFHSKTFKELNEEEKEKVLARLLNSNYGAYAYSIQSTGMDFKKLITKGIINKNNLNFCTLIEKDLPAEYIYTSKVNELYDMPIRLQRGITDRNLIPIKVLAMARNAKIQKVKRCFEVGQNDFEKVYLAYNVSRLWLRWDWEELQWEKLFMEKDPKLIEYYKYNYEEREKTLLNDALNRLLIVMRMIDKNAEIVDGNKVKLSVGGKTCYCEALEGTDLCYKKGISIEAISDEAYVKLDNKLNEYRDTKYVIDRDTDFIIMNIWRGIDRDMQMCNSIVGLAQKLQLLEAKYRVGLPDICLPQSAVAIFPPVEKPIYKFFDITDANQKIAVDTLYSKGIIGGYPNGTFGPNNTLTGEQAGVILSRLTGLKESELQKITAGIAMGKEDILTDEQWLMMLIRASGLEEEVSKTGKGYPDGYMQIAQKNGFTVNSGMMAGGKLTRVHAAVAVYNYLNYMKEHTNKS